MCVLCFCAPPLPLFLSLSLRMGIVASSVHCGCIYNILLYFILSSTHHKFPQGFMFSTAFPLPLGALVCLVVCRLIRHCHNLLHSHFRNGFIELATRGLSMPFPPLPLIIFALRFSLIFSPFTRRTFTLQCPLAI